MDKADWIKVSKMRSFARLGLSLEAILESCFPGKDIDGLWTELMATIVKSTSIKDFEDQEQILTRESL